jgi:hypothetical protein
MPHRPMGLDVLRLAVPLRTLDISEVSLRSGGNGWMRRRTPILRGCESFAHRPSTLALRENGTANKAVATKSSMGGLRARWRGAGKHMLNDLPAAVWLAFEDDDVASFGGDFSAGGDDG